MTKDRKHIPNDLIELVSRAISAVDGADPIREGKYREMAIAAIIEHGTWNFYDRQKRNPRHHD